MQIDWWTLGLQIVNTLVLIWLLTRFLFKPVAKIIAARQVAANQILSNARNIQTEADADRKTAQQKLTNLAQQREATLAVATVEAAALKDDIVKKAMLDADKRLAKSRADINLLQRQLESDTRTHASALALDIANKLMERLPEACRVEGFIDGLADGVTTLPESERKKMGDDGDALRLVSARALTPQQLEHCQQALKAAFGRDVLFKVSNDASLIAGLELKGIHSSVHNSFRADLEHLTHALHVDEH